MTTAPSLRIRLTLIILLPLLAISGLIGVWAVADARTRATEQFDRSLLSTVLAISRDVALSEGDALSPETTQLLRDTSGGGVFYHAYAPDGAFVTGYATPPIPPAEVFRRDEPQIYFDAIYQGRDVRVLRFRAAMQIDGLEGDFTFTVWQDLGLREAMVQDLSERTFGIMAALMVALALIVWFGVRLGLSPLTDLQAAIARRSSDELSPIQRAVPEETQGLVDTLNQLLGQVTSSLKAKEDFISNAAHQILNPIAGVVAMSEAVRSAKTFEDMQERSAELVAAARHASDLTQKLLVFERARALQQKDVLEEADLSVLVLDVVARHKAKAEAREVVLAADVPDGPLSLAANPLMIGEALTNLINNALAHGGTELTRIDVSLTGQNGTASLCVRDNGLGILPQDVARALERFEQLDPAGGSGLGLPIAREVAHKHGGDLALADAHPGLIATMTLAPTQV